MTPGAAPRKQFSSPWISKIFPLLIVAGASVLMTLSARGDLWHDEVWSILFAESAITPLELFFFNHDNNHLLNTLFLYLIGDQDHFIVYRLLSILSGIGALLLVGHIARRLWGNRDAILALILCGFSFPLILMFSEARGYAPAIFFSLLAFACLLRIGDSLKPLPLLLFWAACVLGILAHATFVIIFFAMPAYSLLLLSVAHKRRTTLYPRVVRLFYIYGPPLIFMAGLYLWFFSSMIIGGGPEVSKTQNILQSISLPFGHIWKPGIAVVTGVVTVLIMVAGCFLLFRQQNRLWSFFVAALIAIPVLIVSITRPSYFSPRYLTICLPFFYLLAAHLLGTLVTSGKWKKWMAIVLLALFITGNAQPMVSLLLNGRGQYRAAFEAIVKHSDGDRVVISGDDYYKMMRLILFYRRFLPSSPEIQYAKPSEWEQQRPDWFIAFSWRPEKQPLPLIVIPYIGSYALFGEYRYSGYGSGWHWFLYQKAPPKEQPVPAG